MQRESCVKTLQNQWLLERPNLPETIMNAPDRKAALQGMGDSRLRKEDARFIQGKGNYVDDIKLPGMANQFYRQRVQQHLQIGLQSIDRLRRLRPDQLHSRKLRSFDEVAFR